MFALAKAASLATTEIDKRQFMILMRQVKYTACPVTPANYAKECVCIRNRLFNTLQAVTRTPLALLMLIVDTRINLEKATGKTTSAKVLAYFENCHFGANSEKISSSLVDNANASWTKFKADPSLFGLVRDLETMYGIHGPIRGVLQMYLISLRVKETALLKWVLFFLSGAPSARTPCRRTRSMRTSCKRRGSTRKSISMFTSMISCR